MEKLLNLPTTRFLSKQSVLDIIQQKDRRWGAVSYAVVFLEPIVYLTGGEYISRIRRLAAERRSSGVQSHTQRGWILCRGLRIPI